MTILDLIPIGSENAVTRRDLLNACMSHGIANSDREMRRLIEKERSGACIISLCDGRGYFQPGKNDRDKLKHYVEQEHDRSISILRNLKMANNLLADIDNERVCCE